MSLPADRRRSFHVLLMTLQQRPNTAMVQITKAPRTGTFEAADKATDV
jgi:hypothetical protein